MTMRTDFANLMCGKTSINDFGNSFPPLVLAILHHFSPDDIKYLKENGADINAVNGSGKTSLDIFLGNDEQYKLFHAAELVCHGELFYAVYLIPHGAYIKFYDKQLMDIVLGPFKHMLYDLDTNSKKFGWAREFQDHLKHHLETLKKGDDDYSRKSFFDILDMMMWGKIFYVDFFRTLLGWTKEFCQKFVSPICQSSTTELKSSAVSLENSMKQLHQHLIKFSTDCDAIKSSEALNCIERAFCCIRLSETQKNIRDAAPKKSSAIIDWCDQQKSRCEPWIQLLEKAIVALQSCALPSISQLTATTFHRSTTDSKNDFYQEPSQHGIKARGSMRKGIS